MSQHRVTATFLVEIDDNDLNPARSAVDLRLAVIARLEDECGYDDDGNPYMPIDGSVDVHTDEAVLTD